MRAIVEKADNPDTNIQMLLNDGRWVDAVSTLENIIQSANEADFKFRIKPQTITLNGEELPKPLDVNGRRIYAVRYGNFFYIEGVASYNFSSKEDAEMWADALNKLMGEGK